MASEKPFHFVDKPHFENFIALLMLDGAMCPKCGFGTRKTSKNWRRCKRPECSERIHMIAATKESVEKAMKILATNSTELEGPHG